MRGIGDKVPDVGDQSIGWRNERQAVALDGVGGEKWQDEADTQTAEEVRA